MASPVLYTLTSGLHGEMAPDARREPFIQALEAAFGTPFDCRGDDFRGYGQADAQEVWDSVWKSIGPKAAIGGSIAVAGTAIAITGAILLAVGHKNLKRTVNYTNALGKPQQAAFNFGATPSGVGLTFNF